MYESETPGKNFNFLKYPNNLGDFFRYKKVDVPKKSTKCFEKIENLTRGLPHIA